MLSSLAQHVNYWLGNSYLPAGIRKERSGFHHGITPMGLFDFGGVTMLMRREPTELCS